MYTNYRVILKRIGKLPKGMLAIYSIDFTTSSLGSVRSRARRILRVERSFYEKNSITIEEVELIKVSVQSKSFREENELHTTVSE